MASYIDAAAIVSTGTAFTIYRVRLGLSPAQVGVLSACLTLCIAIGALAGGGLGDRIGRKRVFLATMVLIAVGGLVMTAASAIAGLMTGVLLMGLGVGADLPVSLATIAEAAASDNRGKLISFSQILWSAGVVVSLLLGVVVGDWGQLGARIMLTHVVAVSGLVLVARWTLPESERWARARASRGAAAATGQPQSQTGALLRGPLIRPLVALMLFYAFTNTVANSNGQFGTYFFVQVAGASVSFASLFSLLAAGSGMLATAVFMRFVDTSHRMTLYLLGAVAGVAGMLVPAVVGVNMATLVFQRLSFSLLFGAFAFESIMKVWTQETFPTLVRATAQGVILFTGRVSAATLAVLTPALAETAPQAIFWFLAAMVAAGTGIGFAAFHDVRSAGGR
ncbi:MAG: MFS transporter [Propionicimonas sp.]|nr:MFS transporter [Propionicimonas sp.]